MFVLIISVVFLFGRRGLSTLGPRFSGKLWGHVISFGIILWVLLEMVKVPMRGKIIGCLADLLRNIYLFDICVLIHLMLLPRFMMWSKKLVMSGQGNGMTDFLLLIITRSLVYLIRTIVFLGSRGVILCPTRSKMHFASNDFQWNWKLTFRLQAKTNLQDE